MKCYFYNDNNVEINLISGHELSDWYKDRVNSEPWFRKINTYLIQNNIIQNNIIDLGAWIGDNTIPWAKNINDRIVYAIDPSPDNINFINEMCKLNNISNVITIESAISNQDEILSTDDNYLFQCTFTSYGKNKVSATTLDNLYHTRKIDNIGYIHLDVEGMEEKVIQGANKVIEDFKPIITFEQHLLTDNYLILSKYLSTRGYTIYLNNEILPKCREDCRNLFAFPNTISNVEFLISKINKYLNNDKILSQII
jgi:FkbM family methyltransferase